MLVAAGTHAYVRHGELREARDRRAAQFAAIDERLDLAVKVLRGWAWLSANVGARVHCSDSRLSRTWR